MAATLPRMSSVPPPSAAPPELSLSVPCYNEEEVLRGTMTVLCAAFSERGYRLELVLVDNGSRDRTGAIIDELIAEGFPVVKGRVEQNQGQGLGYLTGLALCRARWVGIIPADGQVEAADVVRLFEAAKEADRSLLVKVRRRFRKDGLRRKLISIAYNLAANVLFLGLSSIDVNGSPKLFLRSDYERMRLCSRDWFLEPEIVIKAKALGIRVLEMNVLGRMREGGQSKVRAVTCLEFVVNLLRARFGRIGPRNPSAARRPGLGGGGAKA